MPLSDPKRSLEAADATGPPAKRTARARKLTLKAREGDGRQSNQRRNTPEMPMEPENGLLIAPTTLNQHAIESLESLPRRPSPRREIALQTSQDTDKPTWESQLMLERLENSIVQPSTGSSAATNATTEDDGVVGVDFSDYNGLDWARLPGFRVPLSAPKGSISWVFQHGWRVWKEGTHHPERLYFVCRYCHQQKIPGGVLQVTKSTSAANLHLAQQKPGHRLSRTGPLLEKSAPPSKRLPGQLSLRHALEGGLVLDRDAHNKFGNFDIQGFRQAAVLWLVDNNHPLCEFESPAFRTMIRFSNPEAEAALWKSHNSVARFVMKLYSWLQPQVVRALSESISKIHVSFDGWTTKGGQRSFFSVVVHYADASGNVVDLPIALPQLVGAHTGERIADVVSQTLQYFGINRTKLGCFILDNAYNNDTAVNKLAAIYTFVAAERRLRCACHVLNLIGQTIMFGKDSDSYANAPENTKEEDFYMKEWRKDGPLGLFLDVVNHINTPKQYELFKSCQRQTLHELGYTDASSEFPFLEPIKPVVTRWNSYCRAFERGIELQQAFTSYAHYHIQETKTADSIAVLKNNKVPEVPRWMRNEGFTAADWAVITEYIAILQPLKHATDRLQARGKSGNFGALYEVIPVFEGIMNELEIRLRPYESVDYEPSEAPEDHIPINLRAARKKAKSYFDKLSNTAVYYTSTILHPRYKHYCERSWRFRRPALLQASHDRFLQLWSTYKPDEITATKPTPSVAFTNSLENIIDSVLDYDDGSEVLQQDDEYNEWLREPAWTAEQHRNGPSVVKYWYDLRPKYPNLAQLALDCMTIPASSADCELVFSGTGNILEPQRRKMGAQLLAALICTQRWIRAGLNPPSTTKEVLCSDQKVDENFDIDNWDEPCSSHSSD